MEESKGLDVIFLVHGSNGSAQDWIMFTDFLDLHFEESAKLYACTSNQGKKTDDGIPLCEREKLFSNFLPTATNEPIFVSFAS